MSDALPPDGDMFEIDGLAICISRSAARGDNLPILMTSPWPESIYAFPNVIPRLDRMRSVFAIDLPGSGLSNGRRHQIPPKAMASFTVKAMCQLGLSRVHAIGPDIGALSLLCAAAESAHIFEGLIVGSGASSAEPATGSLVDLRRSARGSFQKFEVCHLGLDFVDAAAARPCLTQCWKITDDHHGRTLRRPSLGLTRTRLH